MHYSEFCVDSFAYKKTSRIVHFDPGVGGFKLLSSKYFLVTGRAGWGGGDEGDERQRESLRGHIWF